MAEQQIETHPTTSGVSGSEVPAINEVPAKKKSRPIIVAAIVIGVLLVAGLVYYLYSRNYESTDDAQVDGHIAPVAARVDGTIRAVYVENDVYVKVGQPLVDLDPTDSWVALASAEAKYHQAQAETAAQHPNLPITQLNNATSVSTQKSEVANAQAALEVAQHEYDNSAAMLQQARANNDRAQADYARYKSLYGKNEVARAEYDNYAATAEAQQATVAASEASVASAQKSIEQRKAQLAQQQTRLTQDIENAPHQIAIQQANIQSQTANAVSVRAQLEQAKLNLQYCHIVAPVSGVTMQRSAEVGSRISVGQQLFMIVETDDLWVTANFKETQLVHMHPGQHVVIHVDALSRDFDGTVESMPAATGSITSVLPPENATGNYVKVVQRMPVRIRFNPGQAELARLRPGMSVEPKVHLD
ncbi:MAG: HlyD family secretion protein [Terriglobia bacterium]|nr:HlyD family secretion protein [Terriglobia bacterium]